MASSKLECTKKMIRSVLTSSKEGVSSDKFDNDYYSLTQSRVRFQSFGFSTLHNFMLSIPDVVSVSNRGGTLTYHAVASEETQHIQKMVAKQSSRKKRKKTESSKSIKSSKKVVNTIKRNIRGSGGRNFWAPKTQKAITHSKAISQGHSQVKPRAHHYQPRKPAPLTNAMTSIALSSTQRHQDCLEMGKTRKWASSIVEPNSSTGYKVNNIIKNRIRTLLGQNCSGVFSNHLAQLYLDAYDCELPLSVIYSLESGDLCDIAKVEKMASGNRERYIIFPMQHDRDNPVAGSGQGRKQKAPLDERNVREFNIDSEVSTMALNWRMEIRLQSILRQNPRGITSNDFRQAYFQNFGCELPDSILLGIECGQVKNIATLERRKIGNREIIILFPYISCTTRDPKKSATDPKDKLFGKLIDDKVRTRIKQILKAFPDGIDLSRLDKIYFDAFEDGLDEKIILEIKEGNLGEILQVNKDPSGGTIVCGVRSQTQVNGFLKYPGLSIMPSGAVLCAKSLSIGEEHDVLITHIGSCDQFSVQLTSCSGRIEQIFSAAAKAIEFQEIFSLEKGTYVIDSSSLPKRGRVIAESGMHAEVFYMDYGETRPVNKWNLSPLPPELFNIPELAICCTLKKSNTCIPWSERASSKFHQLCYGKRATIKVVSITKKLLNAKEREVHIVSCRLGNLDVNQRLLLENTSFTPITEKKLFNGTRSGNTCEAEKKPGPCDLSFEKASAKSEKEAKLTGKFTVRNSLTLKKLPLGMPSKEMLNVAKRQKSKCLLGGGNLPEIQIKETLNDAKVENLPGVTHPSQSIGQGKVQLVQHVEKEDRVVANVQCFSKVDQLECCTPLSQIYGSQPFPSSRREFYVIAPMQQPFHIRDFGKFITVQVTRVISAEKFYMIPVERISILESLTTSMNEFYNNLQTADSEVAGGGSLYAAPIYVDGLKTWRRVLLQDIASDFASVFLVDIGEVRCIRAQDIRKLHHEYAYLPALAMLGRLAGIKLKKLSNATTANQLFETWVLNQQMVAHLIKTNLVENSLVFDVCLCIGTWDGYGQWINDMMVEDWQVADYMYDV